MSVQVRTVHASNCRCQTPQESDSGTSASPASIRETEEEIRQGPTLSRVLHGCHPTAPHVRQDILLRTRASPSGATRSTVSQAEDLWPTGEREGVVHRPTHHSLKLYCRNQRAIARSTTLEAVFRVHELSPAPQVEETSKDHTVLGTARRSLLPSSTNPKVRP